MVVVKGLKYKFNLVTHIGYTSQSPQASKVLLQKSSLGTGTRILGAQPLH